MVRKCDLHDPITSPADHDTIVRQAAGRVIGRSISTTSRTTGPSSSNPYRAATVVTPMCHSASNPNPVSCSA